MKKELRLLIALFMCLLALAVRAQVPAVVLLQNIAEHANFVGKYGGYKQLSAGKVEFGSHSDVVSEHAQACLKAIDQAIAGGVPESRTIEVKFEDGTRTMSLAELRGLSEQVSGVAGKDAALRTARQAAINASGWPQRISQMGDKFGGPNARVAADAATDCIGSIDKALAGGNPNSTQINLIGDSKMTLSDAREMCVYVRDAATKQVKSDVAAQEAEYAPFRKVLSGDKLRVYNERKRYKLYTTGGRVLRTPDEYKNASVWCTVGVNRDGIVPVWDMSCWRFRDVTQVGAVINKNGAGDTPPSSAFP